MIEECTGLELSPGDGNIRVSGSLENHYAPKAKIYLDIHPEPRQGFIELTIIKTPVKVIQLAMPENAIEFAVVLYASLRSADASGLKEIVIWQPAGQGIAFAIHDRLKRAVHKFN